MARGMRGVLVQHFLEGPRWGKTAGHPALTVTGSLSPVILKDSQQEADLELELMRGELQKAQAVLKARDAEVEGQQKELELARGQVQ